MFKFSYVIILVSVSVYADIQKISDVVVKDLDDKEISFSNYAGNCVMIINTASGCGFADSNMKWLNDIKTRFKDLKIAAFPSNSFGQEKKNNSELKDWFHNKWKVKYDVYAPVSVTDSDVYKFLIKQEGKPVTWNYGKYVVQKDGITVKRYDPQDGAITDTPHNLNKNLAECVSS